jgi:replicative DNA helicase
MQGADGVRANQARTAAQVFRELDDALQSGNAQGLVAIPTGFQPLDQVLRGGLRPGELILVGGAPGVGKTIMTLQWARNVAASGHTAAYVCYEHDERDLLLRLLALEMGGLTDSPDDGRLAASLVSSAASSHEGLAQVLERHPLARQAYDRLMQYADRLWLLRASGGRMGLSDLDLILSGDGHEPPAALFVDYLQKIAIHPEPAEESEKVTRIAEGLKDLALGHRVPVVSVVASDQDGIRAGRLRMHHLRGSSALAFESDVVIVLNEKVHAVSKVHLAYDPVRAESFKAWAVMSMEKNRGGPNLINLEHRKDFSHFRFEPFGEVVNERLADE